MATIPEISTAVTLNGNGHAAHDHDAAQEWADRVTCAIKSSVGSSIAIGETLIAAKEALAHGQWERMFQGHPEAAARPIPFDASTGRRFMMIAAHPLLSNRANWHVLPYSWRTLYELTKVPETILAAALVDGRVHLKMRGADAIALRHDHDAVKRMVRLVRAETLQWGPELLGAFRTALDHDLLARIQGGARARQEVAADLLDLPGPGQTERQWREARWGAGA